MPRLRTLCVLVAATCWLVAGPGYVGLRAAALCVHHGAMPMHHAHATDAPCYCNAMTGALDAAPVATAQGPVSPAIHVPGAVLTGRVSPFPLPASRSLTPDTPPPNVHA